MATSVGDIFLNLKLDKTGFEKGLNGVKSSAGGVGSAIGGKLGVAIAGAVTTAMAGISFGHLISKTTQIGDNIDKMSQKLGMSAQAYQEWDYIMKICGSDIETLKLGIKTLASSAVTSKDALAELGITQEEVGQMSQEQLFNRTISALQQVEDTTKRTYLAGQLLGRGATELAPLLNKSASETEYLRQNLYNLGGAMSQTAISNSAQLADAMVSLKMSFRGIYNVIAETVLPAVTRVIYGVIIPAVQKACAIVRYFASLWTSLFGGLIKSTGFLGKVFGKVTDGFKSVFGKAQTKQVGSAAKALGGVSKGTGGVGKAAKKTKKAVKELTRELMGFDKMNKLAKKQKNASSPSSGGGGGGGAGGVGGIGDLGGAIDDSNKKLFDFSKISEKLAPIWKALKKVFEAAGRLLKAVGKALAPVGKWIWEHLIKPFGKLIGMAIVATLQGIAGVFNIIASAIEKHPKIAALVLSLAAGFLAFKKLGGLAGILGGISKGFKAIFGTLTKGNVIVLALTAIALAIGYIYQNWDKIKKTKFGKFLIKIGNVLKNLATEFKIVATAVKGWFLKVWEKLKPALQKVGGIIRKVVITALRILVNLWRKISPVVKTVAKIIGGILLTAFKGFVKIVKIGIKVVSKIASFFKGGFKKGVEVASKVVGGFKKAWKGIKDKAVSLKAKVADGAENVSDWFSNLGENITDKTVTITASLKDKFSSAWDGIKGAWNSVKDKTATARAELENKFSSAWDKIKGAWNSVKDKKSTLTASISDKFSKIWDRIKKKWNGVKSKTATLGVNVKAVVAKAYNAVARKINQLKAEHPIIFKPIPKLPLLAQGGWVAKNTPQLAVVGDNRHESEIIAPDSKLAAMARQAAFEAAGNSSNGQVVALLAQILNAVMGIDTDVYLDGQKIAQNTVKRINQQTRTTGKSPLLV